MGSTGLRALPRCGSGPKIRPACSIVTLSPHDVAAGCTITGNLVLSGSIDASARLWEVRSGRCLSVKTGHTDEVLDVQFNTTGSSFLSASADGTAR